MRTRVPRIVDRCMYTAYSARLVTCSAFRDDLRRAAGVSGRSRSWLTTDMLRAWRRHQTLPSDYLFFEMWALPDAERSRYVSTLQMYQYQRWANDRRSRRSFRDKRRFRQVFGDYLLNDAVEMVSPEQVQAWLDERRPQTIAAKDPLGQAGRGVEVATAERTAQGWVVDGQSLPEFVTECRAEGLTLLEEGLTQHPLLAELNPTSVNTVRVITRLGPDGSLEIVAAILRVGAGGRMDNFAAGGVTCPLDVRTGAVSGPLRSKGFGGIDSFVHPVSGISLEGFVIPHWDDVLAVIREAARRVPQVRTVGWDVVIGPDAPGLVEGNDNWDKTHWQKATCGPKADVVRGWLEEEKGGVSPWALSVGKRVMDVALGGLAVVLLAPVAAGTALLVRWRLGRPVLFVAERPGLFSVPFCLHKFRTMTDERDGDGELLPPGQRLTRVGRRLRLLSLDEIPELVDVLRGRMSLVGPRPLRMDYLPRYSPGQARRHLVKPGMTGLAQVSGRERLGWEERFALDVQYVATCSFAGDLRILWRTIRRPHTDAEPVDGPLVTAFVGGM